jgi:hypothetical protein
MFNMYSSSIFCLWKYRVQTCGLGVERGSFTHIAATHRLLGVYNWIGYTTSIAHFLYSTSSPTKLTFISVVDWFLHTIHSTYNYIQSCTENILITRQWINQEA